MAAFCGHWTTRLGSLSPHLCKLSMVSPISCTPISAWEVVFLPLEWGKWTFDTGCLWGNMWPKEVQGMLCLWSSDPERAAASSRPAEVQSSGHRISKAEEHLQSHPGQWPSRPHSTAFLLILWSFQKFLALVSTSETLHLCVSQAAPAALACLRCPRDPKALPGALWETLILPSASSHWTCWLYIHISPMAYVQIPILWP